MSDAAAARRLMAAHADAIAAETRKAPPLTAQTVAALRSTGLRTQPQRDEADALRASATVTINHPDRHHDQEVTRHGT